jgi:uncharacterized protein YcnI
VRLRATIVGGIAVVATTVAAGSASAHVQVTPAVVAPGDPVEFTVLVPGERDTGTTKVDLKLPPGLIPFSFADVPGWKRRIVRAADGSAERIVWTGRAAPDGLLRFVFLAGTPEQPTTMEWKALQTYAGGYVARWIGAPDTDYPAAVTEVRVDAPRRNAGGEGATGSDGAAAPGSDAGDAEVRDAGATGTAGVDRPSETATTGGDADWVARGLGIAALVVGLAAGGALIARRGGARRS